MVEKTRAGSVDMKHACTMLFGSILVSNCRNPFSTAKHCIDRAVFVVLHYIDYTLQEVVLYR